MNARVAVVGRLPHVAAAALAAARRRQRRRARAACCWRTAPAEVPVLPFAGLAPDQAVAGPAIVESDTTTVLLRPGDAARMDARGWLDITVPAAG